MPLERTPPHASLVDVLEHVLDKGIVIDAWVSVSIMGLQLLTIEARILVASIQTYLTHSPAIAHIAPVALPVVSRGTLVPVPSRRIRLRQH